MRLYALSCASLRALVHMKMSMTPCFLQHNTQLDPTGARFQRDSADEEKQLSGRSLSSPIRVSKQIRGPPLSRVLASWCDVRTNKSLQCSLHLGSHHDTRTIEASSVPTRLMPGPHSLQLQDTQLSRPHVSRGSPWPVPKSSPSWHGSGPPWPRRPSRTPCCPISGTPAPFVRPRI